MADKKIMITGANGYIGRHVVSYLLDQGNTVLAVDLSSEGMDARAQFCDIPIFTGDKDIYDKLGRPDVCIHLAWRNGFVHNSDTHIQDLPEHYMFLKNMMEGGLPQLVVMGSMHEVGYWEGSIDENTPTNPLSMYGIAKNSLRQTLQLLAEKNNTCLQWLRGFYIVGDDARGSSIFAKLVQAEAEGKKTFPFTSGKNKYDFLSLDELAAQIGRTALQTEVTGIINCCSGTPVALAERVEQFIVDNGLHIKLDYGAFPDRPYDSPAIWGDNTKIRKIMERVKAVDLI